MMLLLTVSLVLAAELETRDLVDGEVVTEASEHFAVWFGPDASLDSSDATALLDVLEEAWDLEFETLGLVRPLGSDRARVNVYVHSTGLTWSYTGQALPAMPDASFATMDLEGWPALFVHPDHVAEADGDMARVVLSHELAHASQQSSGTFAHDAWYPEASAVWVEHQFSPSGTYEHATWLGWLYAPAFGLEANLIDQDLEGLVHAYGSYVFLEQITADYGHELIVESWRQTGGQTRAVDRLDQLLQAEGTTFEAYWVDTLPALWLLDVSNRQTRLEAYATILEEAEVGPDPWDPLGEPLTGDGSAISIENAPERYGIAPFRADDVDGRWTVHLDGAPTGSEGTPTTWGAVAIAESAEDYAAWTVPLSDHSGVLDVVLPADTERFWVLATPLADEYVAHETFAVDVRLEPTPEEEVPRACGCRSTGSAALWWLALPLILVRRSR